MLQAFIIVLREGIEAFLVVAVITAYLRKTGQGNLLTAVYGGVFLSILASTGLGYFLWTTQGEHQPVLEGTVGIVTVVLVGSLLVHIWKTGPALKRTMESQLASRIQSGPAASAFGVLLFTLVMICREGMEMTLLLFQIHESQIVTGALLGVLGAAAVAILWQQVSYFINWGVFFRITTVFLGFFLLQIAFQSFHEFTEAGILPNSEFLHKITEPYSTEGFYGKVFANLVFAGCGLWLALSLIREKFFQNKPALSQANA